MLSVHCHMVRHPDVRYFNDTWKLGLWNVEPPTGQDGRLSSRDLASLAVQAPYILMVITKRGSDSRRETAADDELPSVEVLLRIALYSTWWRDLRDVERTGDGRSGGGDSATNGSDDHVCARQVSQRSDRLGSCAAAVEQPKLELLVARSQGPKHGRAAASRALKSVTAVKAAATTACIGSASQHVPLTHSATQVSADVKRASD